MQDTLPHRAHLRPKGEGQTVRSIKACRQTPNSQSKGQGKLKSICSFTSPSCKGQGKLQSIGSVTPPLYTRHHETGPKVSLRLSGKLQSMYQLLIHSHRDKGSLNPYAALPLPRAKDKGSFNPLAALPLLCIPGIINGTKVSLRLSGKLQSMYQLLIHSHRDKGSLNPYAALPLPRTKDKEGFNP